MRSRTCQHAGWYNLFVLTMWSSSLFTWLMCGVLVFWAVGAYNRLVLLRSAALQAFGAMDAQLLRHAEVVQTLAPSTPDVSMRSALSEEDAAVPVEVAERLPGALERADLQAASDQFAVSLAAARAAPLDQKAMAALADALSALGAAWQSASAASGPFDNQLADSPPLRWEQWAGQTQGARDHFNAAVSRHNSAVSQFPAWLLAKMFSFKMAGTL